MKILAGLQIAFLGSGAVGTAIQAPNVGGHQGACAINHHPPVSDLKGVSYIKHVNSVHLPHSGRNYRYVHVPPTCETKEYILFLHGFPESSFDWRFQIEHFSSLGYGVVAPDLLGYGGTDKPANLDAYRMKPMAAQVIEIMDCLGIDKFHAVSHDFGSPLLSRVANFYPARLLTTTFIDIGYDAPPIPTDEAGIDYLNNLTLHTVGYEAFGYWYFMNQPNSGEVLNAHYKSMWSLFEASEETIIQNLCPRGALEKFIRAGRIVPPVWGSDKERAIHNRIFDPANGGYKAPVNWFKATMRDLNTPDEATVPPGSVNLTMPVLLIGAKNDPVGTPEFARASTEPYAANFQFELIDSGHFVMEEKPEDTNRVLGQFLEKHS